MRLNQMNRVIVISRPGVIQRAPKHRNVLMGSKLTTKVGGLDRNV